MRNVRNTLYLIAAGAMLMLALMLATGHAKADPYCGPGNNYDARHEICQPGGPQWNGGQGSPYPLPGDYGPGGYGPAPYGGN